MRRIHPALLALALLSLCASPAIAQSVYKWKDAKGVTHYSESPPVKGNYTSRDAAADPARDAQAAGGEAGGESGNTAPARPVVDTRCNTARANLAMLNGKGPVQIDSNNDGKPDRELSDAERVSQLELTRATLKAYNCSDDVAG